jgi:hypothetical protein
MAFGDNSHLITTATIHNDTTTGTTANDILGDGLGGDSVATSQADTYYFDNSAVQYGDEQIVNFGHEDSIVNYKHIFDGNNDGIIDFGPNGVLDIDRTSAKLAGADQITVKGIGGADISQLRYLGSKSVTGTVGTALGDGAFVYADASTRLKAFTEGTVGNDTFNGALANVKGNGGHNQFFFDTALGLNLGGDTINNFGTDDQIVTTTRIHNGSDQGAAITFGKNLILDLPGDTNGIHGDVGPSEGGQIAFSDTTIHMLYLESVDTTSTTGVTYYHYGLTPPAIPV